MHHDLHTLDISHMRVTRTSLVYEPRADKSKKSLEQGASQPFIEKGHVTTARVVP